MSILQTTLDATADALMDSGQKEAGHIMQAATVASFVIEPGFIKYDSWYDVGIKSVMLVGARVLLFNLTYNAVRGLPLGYHGTTSYYDKFWNQQPVPGWGVKTGFFVATVHFTLNYWEN